MNNSSTPQPERALVASPGSAAPGHRATGFERAANAMRMALPFVQRLLPLLDGNVGSAVSNLMNQHQPAPPPPVDLAPIEDALAELQAEHRNLHGRVFEQTEALGRAEEQLRVVGEATGRNTVAQQEQNELLKRVEVQLEMLCGAADRNALAQQALLDELKSVRQKVKLLALLALALLVGSIVLNVIPLLHLHRILP